MVASKSLEASKMEQTNLTWQEAIMECFKELNGKATNQEIYESVGRHILLNEEHLKIVYNQLNYRHQVRRHLTDLRRKNLILPLKRGCNVLAEVC